MTSENSANAPKQSSQTSIEDRSYLDIDFHSVVPSSDTLWRDITPDQLAECTPALLRRIKSIAHDDDVRFYQLVNPARRALDRAQIVRATVWLHQAQKLPGFLADELEAGSVKVAANAASSDIALNAAVFRLLTSASGVDAIDKHRVSRSALAMEGVKHWCNDEGLGLTFEDASEILYSLANTSRRALCELARQRRNMSIGPEPCSEMVGETSEGMSDETLAADPHGTPSCSAAGPRSAGAAARHHSVSSAGEIGGGNQPPKIGSLPLPDHFPSGRFHIVLAESDGVELLFRGPLLSGSAAETLVGEISSRN